MVGELRSCMLRGQKNTYFLKNIFYDYIGIRTDIIQTEFIILYSLFLYFFF